MEKQIENKLPQIRNLFSKYGAKKVFLFGSAATNKFNENSDVDFLYTFPEDIDYKKIKGTISLYRPSNQKLDFEMKISLSSPIMLIPNHKLIGGLWEISINWNVDEVAYLNKETVYF